MIEVLLADDHALVRAGIKRLLEEAKDIDVIAEASNGKEALEKTKSNHPDVVILDISMPIMDGIDTCKQLKTSYPQVNILILTVHNEDLYALRLLSAGALGYVTKRASAKELHEAVRVVSQGNIYLSNSSKDRILYQLLHQKGNDGPLGVLSDREVQVFYLLSQGKKIKEVANELNLSIKTAENYRSHILCKLELKRTVDLVAFAHRHNLIQTS